VASERSRARDAREVVALIGKPACDRNVGDWRSARHIPDISMIETPRHHRKMREHGYEDVVRKERRGVLRSCQHRIECSRQVEHGFIDVLNADRAMQLLDP
jgi:hypothetical protein